MEYEALTTAEIELAFNRKVYLDTDFPSPSDACFIDSLQQQKYFRKKQDCKKNNIKLESQNS